MRFKETKQKFYLMKKLWLLCIGTIAISSSLQIRAADYELQLYLEGKITERCEINATPHQGAQMDFSTQISNSASLYIDCNQPMKITVTSEQGGLAKLDTTGSAISGKSYNSNHTHIYQADISIAGIGFNIDVSSKDLKNGMQFDTAGEIPFKSLGTLKVRLKKPLLIAGDYQDTLHLEVSPAAGSGGI